MIELHSYSSAMLIVLVVYSSAISYCSDDTQKPSRVMGPADHHSAWLGLALG